MSTIAENIASVRVRMAEAARAAGRSPQEILLCGASKMNDAAACREAISAGIDCLGENRVQEMVQKRSEHAYVGAPLHFIGVLQKNKVRQVVGQVDLIHSVDSMGLLDEIDKRAAMNGLTQNILLEVNIGGEDSKSGFRPEEGICHQSRPCPAGAPCAHPGPDGDSPIAEKRAKNMPYFLKCATFC